MAAKVDTDDLRQLLQPGKCVCLVTDSVEEKLAELHYVWERHNAPRRIVLQWPSPPRVDQAVADILSELARLAAQLWPDWCGLHLQAGEPLETHLQRLSSSWISRQSAAKRTGGLSTEWLARAWRACQRGQDIPLTQSAAVSARHLLSLFSPDDPIVLLAVTTNTVPVDRFDGLQRAADFLASQTHCRVGLLCSEQLVAAHPATALPSLTSRLQPTVVIAQRGLPALSEVRETAENKGTFGPWLGRPHPASPGEQRLARALEQDAQLRGAFEFNVPVTTESGSTYVVDLLAAREKVIIEIDSYRYHGTRVAFASDRHRDFELQISGYLVIRLPHDEVMHDTAACLQKLQQALEARRTPPAKRRSSHA